jgi:hypothetical protein
MKLTDAEIKIVDGQLLIDGNNLHGLFEEADQEPNIRKHVETAASLPSEDLTPGHVFPAVVLTTSRAA